MRVRVWVTYAGLATSLPLRAVSGDVVDLAAYQFVLCDLEQDTYAICIWTSTRIRCRCILELGLRACFCEGHRLCTRLSNRVRERC